MDAEGQENFREFVEKRSSALLKTAVLLNGGDRHAAEDLLQNALIKAAGRWHRIDEPEAYVRQILHRQQVNRWRLKWPRRELSVPEPLESPARQGADDGPGAADLRIVTDDRAVAVRTYRLLDQKTGKYVKTTKWSFIDVAPGMRTAAVLEKDLPAKRIGLLNLLTGEVERWIPVDRGVAGVEFSPDGSKLVATTYSTNPDLRYKADYDSNGDGKKNDWMPQYGQSNRTGFYVIDMEAGKGSWSEATYNSDDLNVRQDFAFSHDGKLVYSGLTTDPTMQYYDFEGNEVSKPVNEEYVHWFNDAGLSPDGKLVAGDYAGDYKKSASELLTLSQGFRNAPSPQQ